MENEIKKAGSGKIALAIAAVVVLVAVLAALIYTGMAPKAEDTTPATVAATIPADGNPEDETAKGTYTASDEEVIAAADVVVARMGEYTLTNSQFQVFYWMEVQNFLNNYGSYAPYFGLDYTKPLDTQVCGISETGCTWQQFFVASALNSWKSFQSMGGEADKAGFKLDPEMQAELDGMEEIINQNAILFGMSSGEEFLAANVGKGATMEDYLHYMNLYYTGTLYFDNLCAANAPTDEEVEAYFAENEATYAESGLKREDVYVSVRHALIMPEGASSENIRTETFDDAAWAASETKANELLAEFEKGDKSEESFSALAMEHSQDGSAANGGLYTDVAKGQMVEAFENWCFDAARKPGDYGLVKTEFGYHLMYFVSSRPVWVEQVRSELTTNRNSALLSEIVDSNTVDADFTSILLGYVNLGGAAQEPAEEVVAESLFDEEHRPMMIIAGASAAALIAAAYVLHKKEKE